MTSSIFHGVPFVFRAKSLRIQCHEKAHGPKPNNYEIRGGSYDRMNLHTHPRLDESGNGHVSLNTEPCKSFRPSNKWKCFVPMNKYEDTLCYFNFSIISRILFNLKYNMEPSSIFQRFLSKITLENQLLITGQFVRVKYTSLVLKIRL